MSDRFRRIDTTKLYAPFLAKLELLLDACARRGAVYIATSGYRSFADQTELFAQGRTKPGQIITNARAGESPHNFGVAVDFTRDKDLKPGLQPSWTFEDYEILAVEAERLSLEAGKHWPRFKDPPHIQLPIASKGLTWKQLKEAHPSGAGKLTELLDLHDW